MSLTVGSDSTRLITWLAGIVMVMITVAFPMGYYVLSYQYSAGSLQTEAEINSRIISRIICENPDMWQFEKVRIEAYLSQRPRIGHAETRRVFNARGELVVESADVLHDPVITQSYDLFDSGTVVGRIEVTRSLWPLLIRTGLLTLGILPIGVGVFLVLRIVPIRTIKRRVEEALKKERDTAQQYLDVAGVMLIAIDAEQRVTMINRKGCEVLGYPENEILHKSWFDFVPQKSRSEAINTFVRLGEGTAGHSAHLESSVQTMGGEERVIEWHHIRLTGADGTFTGALSSGDDVTERRNLEIQLRHAQKMDAIGQLASGVAHDFNNILTVIIGYCSLIKNKMDEEDPKRMHIKQVLAAAERASNLTSSLLMFSRKEAINPRKADLNTIVTTIGKFIQRIIGEDVQLTTVIHKEPLDVYVDTGQIEQVLVNLSTNARDAMEKGGVILIETSFHELDITFVQAHGYGVPGRYALITVSDSGKGMDGNTLKRIFEPFFTTKEVGKGTGLGLSIVYGVVKQHSGFINVYSEQATGTSFKVYLPLIKRKQAADDEMPVLPHPVMGTETILVAEDEPAVRRLITSVLIEFGYQVILAEDGQDAVDKFVNNSGKIQLVLMDIIMPNKGGKEAFDEIRKLEPGMKGLFTSGYSENFIKSRGKINNDIEVLTKPINPMNMLRKIRELLENNEYAP